VAAVDPFLAPNAADLGLPWDECTVIVRIQWPVQALLTQDTRGKQ